MIEEIDVEEIETDFAAPAPMPAPVSAPVFQPPHAVPAPVPVPATQAWPPAPAPATFPSPGQVVVRKTPPQGVPQMAPVSAPATMSGAVISGEHRVVVHTIEGQVKRGTVRAVNLDAEVLDLEIIPGQPPERIPTRKMKAVFFLLAPGAKPSSSEGQKLRVTFFDERQVAGFAPVYRPEDNGFFMFPADTRTNTARIYIYRAAVKSIARG